MAFFGQWFDVTIALYMILHIPTTILVDSQSVVPRSAFPQFARDLLDWHIKVNSDTLVSTNPPWFLGLVWFEVLVQLPFFFVCAYAFIYQRKWIRIPALIYGVHTATTLIPILAQIAFEENWGLAGIYFPYFLIPLLLAAKMCVMPDPFPYAAGKGRGKGKGKRA